MKASTLLFCSAVATLWTACGSQPAEPATSAPPFSTAAVKTVLDSMNTHYHDRFRDSTPAYFAARYTSDACVFAPNMPRVCGIEGITKFYWYNGDNQSTTLDIKGEEVSGTANEVTEVGNYKVIDDEGTVLDSGKFIAIYRNEGGAWKVHREIWNSDLSLEQPKDSTATEEG